MFVPDTYFMGAEKNNEVLKDYTDYLKKRSLNGHITREYEFLGDTSIGCISLIDNGKMNLIGGEYIGVKTNKRKPVLVEDLMEDNFLDLNPLMYGIYIPESEILIRPKYQWFAVLSTQQILETKTVIAKYIKASMVDAFDKSSEIKSLIAI